MPQLKLLAETHPPRQMYNLSALVTLKGMSVKRAHRPAMDVDGQSNRCTCEALLDVRSGVMIPTHSGEHIESLIVVQTIQSKMEVLLYWPV